MGNSEENYENDPYIQQSQNNNAIRNLYSNSGLVPLSEHNGNNGSVDVKQLTEQQEKITTTAYKNPIKIDRNSIKLERNAYQPREFFISFNYSSEKIIYCNFYFNTNFTPMGNMFFTPTPAFTNNIIKLSIPPGNNLRCEDKNLKIDIDYFIKNKLYDKNLTDLVIELFVMDDKQQSIECILATFCKIVSKPNTNNFETKFICQKCKVMNSPWYNLEDIYGLTSDENLCDICCCNPRNTFFLPCKHSFACQECAILLRIKGNGCPICRRPISDSVILSNANSSNPQ